MNRPVPPVQAIAVAVARQCMSSLGQVLVLVMGTTRTMERMTAASLMSLQVEASGYGGILQATGLFQRLKGYCPLASTI